MLFNDPLFDRLFEAPSFGRAGIMPMDAFRKDDEFVLRFDLPGVQPEDISIEVEGRDLTIKADRAWEDTDGAVWLVHERPQGSHSRQIKLGSALDAGNLSASYDQGVLSVVIPVKEEAKPRKISIDVGASHKVLEAASQ
jgi:HSP20 family protein